MNGSEMSPAMACEAGLGIKSSGQSQPEVISCRQAKSSNSPTRILVGLLHIVLEQLAIESLLKRPFFGRCTRCFSKGIQAQARPESSL